jgi:AmiR/NasT family two-component response regulator
MKRTGLNEPASFRRLQKMASEKRRKLVEIAEIIVMTEGILQPHNEP